MGRGWVGLITFLSATLLPYGQSTHTHTAKHREGWYCLSLIISSVFYKQTAKKKNQKTHKTAKSKTYGHRSPITLSMKHPEKCNDAKNIKTIIICTVIVVIVIIMRLDKIT